MRVAFDGRSLSARALRGWDRYTVGLVEALVEAGVEVTLFHGRTTKPRSEHVGELGCTLVQVPGRRGLYWEQVAVPRALRHGDFDLFHAPAEHGVPLVCPCPAILTVHSVTDHSYVDLVRSGQLTGPVAKYLGYEARPYRWTLSNLYWRSQVLRASHILTPSDFARKEVIKFLDIPESRVTTTYLAVDRRFHQPPLPPDARSALLDGLRVREPYLLFVGGFEPHKNVPGLLDVFSLVHAAAPDFSLVIVGSKGIPHELLRHARDMGLDPDGPVRFLSDLTDELPALYDAATLFVTMSWRETFCLPALEAMTRGVPVVASRWGALPEIVGEQGSLIDPRDHAGAASTILALLEHDNAAAAAAARRAAARFDWSTTCSQTLDVYRRVLGA